MSKLYRRTACCAALVSMHCRPLSAFRFDGDYVPNASDGGGRYRFSAQPAIAQWNLSTLVGLFRDTLDEPSMKAVLDRFSTTYSETYERFVRNKFGLVLPNTSDVDAVVCAVVSGLAPLPLLMLNLKLNMKLLVVLLLPTRSQTASIC